MLKKKQGAADKAPLQFREDLMCTKTESTGKEGGAAQKRSLLQQSARMEFVALHLHAV
jgi:hypothetical protein